MILVNRYQLTQILNPRIADLIINKSVRMGIKKHYRNIQVPSKQFKGCTRILTAVHLDLDEIETTIKNRKDNRTHVKESDANVLKWVETLKEALQ